MKKLHYYPTVSKSQFLLLVGGGWLLVLTIIITLAFSPMLTEISRLNTSMSSKQTLIEQTSTLVEQIATSESDYAALNELLNETVAHLSGDTLPVLKKIQQLAESHTLQLHTLLPLDSAKYLQFDVTPFAIELRGDYLSHYGWLKELESHYPYGLIESYEIRPVSSELHDNPMLTAKVKLIFLNKLTDEN